MSIVFSGIVKTGIVTASIVTNNIVNTPIGGAANLIQNGGFTDGSFWNALGGWTIDNDVANNDGTVGTLGQTINLG